MSRQLSRPPSRTASSRILARGSDAIADALTALNIVISSARLRAETRSPECSDDISREVKIAKSVLSS